MPNKRGPKNMSDEHKAAMHQGRTESKAVSGYLDALRATKPRRGRRRTQAAVEAELASIDEKLASADVVEELMLVQRRRDLQAELAGFRETVDVDGARAEFVSVARSYGERNGISYASWREVGVPSDVLREAGISR